MKTEPRIKLNYNIYVAASILPIASIAASSSLVPCPTSLARLSNGLLSLEKLGQAG